MHLHFFCQNGSSGDGFPKAQDTRLKLCISISPRNILLEVANDKVGGLGAALGILASNQIAISDSMFGPALLRGKCGAQVL